MLIVVNKTHIFVSALKSPRSSLYVPHNCNLRTFSRRAHAVRASRRLVMCGGEGGRVSGRV